MIFDERYYQQFYRNYRKQNPPWKLAYYLRTIEKHHPEKHLRLCDVGCGLGAFLDFVQSRRHYELCGTDVSEYALAQNRKAMPTVEFRLAGADEVVYDPQSFDVVTAFDVIEHVPDLQAVKAAFLQLLRPGGLAVVVVPVYDGLSGPVIRALDKDPTHVHKEPRQFWLDWASSGFALEYWSGILRYYLPIGFYVHLPLHWLRWHTPAILMVLRKPH